MGVKLIFVEEDKGSAGLHCYNINIESRERREVFWGEEPYWTPKQSNRKLSYAAAPNATTHYGFGALCVRRILRLEGKSLRRKHDGS